MGPGLGCGLRRVGHRHPSGRSHEQAAAESPQPGLTGTTIHSLGLLDIPLHRILTSPSPTRTTSGWRACRPWLGAFVVASACFAAIAHSVSSGGLATRIDRIAALHVAHDGGALEWLATRISAWHGTAGLVLMAVALALFLLRWRKAKLGAALVVVAMLGGAVVNSALKDAFARARPDAALLSGAATGYAFPSGHVMLATILYGLVLLCTASRYRSPLARLFVAAAVSAMVALVSAGRVWSGAHYVSDVLAAVPAGVAWLSLLVAAACFVAPRSAADSHNRPLHG